MATASSGGWATWMAEVAAEELAKLEAAHPGRLGPLKAELQRLVDEPAVLDAPAFQPILPRPAGVAEHSLAAPPPPPPHLSGTQESSTRKRKPGGACERKDGKRRRRRSSTVVQPLGQAKDSAVLAIDRAERCLEKIRAIKRSLLDAWTSPR